MSKERCNPESMLCGKSLRELFIYFAQRMTRMWANYGVQMSTGSWYLLCFLVFCFTGKGGVRASCRKLKPDALDVKWVFLMLRVINSWNNRRGNLVDPPRLQLLIKARRTWRMANMSVAMLLPLDFLYNQWRYERFLQGEWEQEPSLFPVSLCWLRRASREIRFIQWYPPVSFITKRILFPGRLKSWEQQQLLGGCLAGLMWEVRARD